MPRSACAVVTGAGSAWPTASDGWVIVMAQIHVLDAYRDTTHVVRLTADLAKLLGDANGELGAHEAYLRTAAAGLRKQADFLHYLGLRLQVEADALAANSTVAPSEKEGMLSAVRGLSGVLENLIKSIRKLQPQATPHTS